MDAGCTREAIDMYNVAGRWEEAHRVSILMLTNTNKFILCTCKCTQYIYKQIVNIDTRCKKNALKITAKKAKHFN